jgi:hypothetical protein
MFARDASINSLEKEEALNAKLSFELFGISSTISEIEVFLNSLSWLFLRISSKKELYHQRLRLSSSSH